MTIITFHDFLNEADLTGVSRSRGKPNWEAYIADDPNWKTNTYKIERSCNLLNDKFEEISPPISMKKGESISILSIDLKKKGPTLYANIKFGETSGFVKIKCISKPSSKKNKNTKKLTPKTLGLNGKRFTIDTLVSAIKSKLDQSIVSPQVKDYINDVIETITNKKIFEKVERFEKTLKLSKIYQLDPSSELNVISKNFGEILAALFILRTSKKAKQVEFPAAENFPLCDFIVINQSEDDRTFVSVKSGGGSSTDIKNLKIFLPYVDVDESSPEWKTLQIIMSNVKDIKEGDTPKDERSTISTILSFFANSEIGKKSLSSICKTLGFRNNTIDIAQISNLWQMIMTEKAKGKSTNLYKKLTDFYNLVGYSANQATIDDIFKPGQKKDISSGGFIIYPLGSYIVKTLNSNPKMLALLNSIIQLSEVGSNVQQSTVDATNKDITFKIIRFNKNQFKFSYNAMMKSPANRPLGFSEVK